ncbi:hypothetical protein ACUY3K_02960 [Corynebacterium uberis]
MKKLSRTSLVAVAATTALVSGVFAAPSFAAEGSSQDKDVVATAEATEAAETAEAAESEAAADETEAPAKSEGSSKKDSEGSSSKDQDNKKDENGKGEQKEGSSAEDTKAFVGILTALLPIVTTVAPLLSAVL